MIAKLFLLLVEIRPAHEADDDLFPQRVQRFAHLGFDHLRPARAGWGAAR